MSQTVIGIFEDKAKAQHAMQQLTSNGFASGNIDISTDHTNQNAADSGSEDSISRFFSSLFGNNDEAANYTNVARRSPILTVHAKTKEEAQKAATIMDQYGTVDVEERARQYRNNSSGNTTGAIPIIEEKMEVGKKVVETGGARLRSRIVERPVQENIRLREEHITVERNAVNRPATEADFANFKEGDVKITERAEVPVVGKEARVVEEVRLDKKVEEHQETIKGTVRKTEVDVEQKDKDRNAGRKPNS